jgi:formate-dependent nitrite reductase membrane component NrfD
VSDEAPRPAGRLEDVGTAPGVARADEPPSAAEGRETAWTADHGPDTRDTTAATGTRGAPASWRRAQEGADVRLARPGWGDAQWSYLFTSDTEYADVQPEPGEVAAANRAGRLGPMPATVHGPVIKPPVWTWEVPLYFWIGGVASGSAFVALACNLAGDAESAAVARKVALGAVGPAPLLLIADLGRPGRFLNMLRIFKPRSPMNLGAWCLVAFSTVGAGAVGADLLGRPRAAAALGAAEALLGGYLGSYTGVLLASTAVPAWARSRLFLGPIFVATATATGAAATRLVLVARGLPDGHPTRTALGRIETASMVTELVLSGINRRRLGRAGAALRTGSAHALFRAAEAAVVAGLALRLGGRRKERVEHHVASSLYLAAGLAFRFAWVHAGRTSAADDEAVARMARGHVTRDDEARGAAGRPPQRAESSARAPHAVRAGRVWTEAVRRASLAADAALRRVSHL